MGNDCHDRHFKLSRREYWTEAQRAALASAGDPGSAVWASPAIGRAVIETTKKQLRQHIAGCDKLQQACLFWGYTWQFFSMFRGQFVSGFLFSLLYPRVTQRLPLCCLAYNSVSIYIDIGIDLRYYVWNYIISLNRWRGDNGNDAFTESLRCWEPGKKQVVKWTAEGAVKSKSFVLSILRRCRQTLSAGDMLVSC